LGVPSVNGRAISFRESNSDRPPKRVIPAARALAFTVAPHLQLINYRGCFSRFAGI
jgi:hypothetical protein